MKAQLLCGRGTCAEGASEGRHDDAVAVADAQAVPGQLEGLLHQRKW